MVLENTQGKGRGPFSSPQYNIFFHNVRFTPTAIDFKKHNLPVLFMWPKQDSNSLHTQTPQVVI